MTERPPLVTTHRDEGNDAAILFIHGYSGHPEVTWGRFPELLAAEQRLSRWDVYSIGYYTSLAPDVLRGLWSARPALDTLGDLLRTTCDLSPLEGYGAVAIIAHSMGGLVAQHALLNRAFRKRVGHVVLFGTPSAGLRKASILSFWQRQLRDMGEDSAFIRDLRERWTREMGAPLPFEFWPVAGDEDEFVPRGSSLAPFPGAERVIPGDHLSIVKPKDASAPSVQLVLKAITGDAAPTGPLESARIAMERGEFQHVVAKFGPHPGELDNDALVLLALALDGLGRRDEAVRVLEERGATGGTDVLGTLGGRIKRRWVGQRRKADAELAQALYQQGYDRAAAAGDHAQAYYHAINLAFLQLCFHHDVAEARRVADTALEHCAADEARITAAGLPDRGALWRIATEAEARLVRGETDQALGEYRRAVGLHPDPWQALSMYWQARLVAEELGDEAAIEGLDALFGLKGTE